MIGLSRRKHLHESHCLARQWLPLRAVTLTRIAAQLTSDRSMLNRKLVGQRAGGSTRRSVSGAGFLRGGGG
jgi:hypothetical protein